MCNLKVGEAKFLRLRCGKLVNGVYRVARYVDYRGDVLIIANNTAGTAFGDYHALNLDTLELFSVFHVKRADGSNRPFNAVAGGELRRRGHKAKATQNALMRHALAKAGII